jgi:hypothetical protein
LVATRAGSDSPANCTTAPYPPKFRASALGYRPTAGARRPRRARAASFRGGDVIGDFARWPPASQSLRAARGAGEVGRRNGFEGRREPVIGGRCSRGRCSRGRYSTGGDSHVLRDCRSGSDRVRAEDVSERAFGSVATWLRWLFWYSSEGKLSLIFEGPLSVDQRILGAQGSRLESSPSSVPKRKSRIGCARSISP